MMRLCGRVGPEATDEAPACVAQCVVKLAQGPGPVGVRVNTVVCC